MLVKRQTSIAPDPNAVNPTLTQDLNAPVQPAQDPNIVIPSQPVQDPNVIPVAPDQTAILTNVANITDSTIIFGTPTFTPSETERLTELPSHNTSLPVITESILQKNSTKPRNVGPKYTKNKSSFTRIPDTSKSANNSTQSKILHGSDLTIVIACFVSATLVIIAMIFVCNRYCRTKRSQ